MFDFVTFTQLFHHFVVQVGAIVSDDLVGESVATYYLLFDEPDTTCFVTLAYEIASTHLVK